MSGPVHRITEDERRMATGNLREPVEVLLAARPAGLGEAMLIHLLRMDDTPTPLARYAAAGAVEPDDLWIPHLREACRHAGATRDADGVWSVA